MLEPGKVNGEIVETIIADQLTESFAAIRRHRVLVVPSKEDSPLANPPVIELRNSPKGREDLQKSDLPSKWKQAIFLVWGDKAIEEDDPEEIEPDPNPPYEPEVKPTDPDDGTEGEDGETPEE